MHTKGIILELLHDMEDFAKLKGIKCEPLYLLGGSGCILMDYMDRATTDIDFLDMDFHASTGRVFKLLESFDMLDVRMTSVSPDFAVRAIRIQEFKYLDLFVLAKEDIIVSKLARYSEKDQEDIEIMVQDADKVLIRRLIEAVSKREDFAVKVKEHFMQNAAAFMERYHV